MEQILAVLVLYHGLGQLAHAFGGDPALAIGNALETGDLETLALFDDFNEGGGFAERIVCAGVQPGETSAKGLHLELAILKELLIHGGDFQFATGRGFYLLGYAYHLVGIEIEAYHGVIGLGMGGFFLDAEAIALAVELGHAVAFGVADPIAEHRGTAFFLGLADCLLQHGAEAGSMEDVVSEYQAGGIVADEFLADDEGLCQTVGTGLFGIFEPYSVIASVAQQTLEPGEVMGRGDDEYLADAGQHQHRDGVIDHGFVKDGEHLLAHPLCYGIEAGSAASG